MTTDEKYLDKLSKLLRLAESTDNEAEAATYMAKAQQLASATSLSLEVARQRQADKEKRQAPVQKRISLGESGKKGLKHYVNLFLAIARQNDLKMNIYHDSSGVIAFGFPTDIDVTEMLYASLVTQMIDASDRYLRSGEYKNELSDNYDYKRGCYKPVDGRVARANFQEAFIGRISSRLAIARMEAMDEARAAEVDADGCIDLTEPNSGTDIVLRNKEIELQDFYQGTSKARGSWRGNTSSKGYSGSARSAGRAAGDSARLSAARGIGSGGKAITR